MGKQNIDVIYLRDQASQLGQVLFIMKNVFRKKKLCNVDIDYGFRKKYVYESTEHHIYLLVHNYETSQSLKREVYLGNLLFLPTMICAYENWP